MFNWGSGFGVELPGTEDAGGMFRISSDGVPVEGARDDSVAARVLPVCPAR